ncbi:hypothetical protein G5B35_01675 [Parapusillimonas sp. SGNA-6]|nr:hypothetical protein [Parapusillimonas sp. SGNA-6]
MVTALGPSIFWTTLVSTAAILSLSTLIGRAWRPLFPNALSRTACLYIAPVLGIASLTVFASLFGTVLPLGDSVIPPLFVLALLICALVIEPSIIAALRHAAMVSAFGVACGASVLTPLFIFGGFNSHNDAFTYLVHANWLQDNAFNNVISASDITPLNSQVALYQNGQFRMGGSFWFALAQSLLNLRWSYEVYSAVIASAMAACCLSMGFPLARFLRPVPLWLRLMLLCLPAFTLGGLVFGANYGFLPQTLGLTFGAGLLFALGPLLQWAATNPVSSRDLLKAVSPPAVLFAAAGFAYSELLPFVLAAALGSSCFLAFRSPQRLNIFKYTALLICLSSLILNTELTRTYAALRTQSSAVVGSPVDWTLLGYVSHSLGLHGGAWDGSLQWSLPSSFGSVSFFAGTIITGLTIIGVLRCRRLIWRATRSGSLMPAALITILFVVGLIYFRYFVASPFPIGTGQSWSQFKLSEWANPFVAVFVLLAIVGMRRHTLQHFKLIVLSLFLCGVAFTVFTGSARIAPLAGEYPTVHDLNNFYHNLRKIVERTCPQTSRVYIALDGQDYKLRQTILYYLPEQLIVSDWSNDDYINNNLPENDRIQKINRGDCVIELDNEETSSAQGVRIGPFRVGIIDGTGHVRIEAPDEGYDRETDGENWWYWIEKGIHFKLSPLFVSSALNHTRLDFQYATRTEQTLTIQIYINNGSSRQLVVHSKAGDLNTFNGVVDLRPSELSHIVIKTDGIASRLGENDARRAAWMIRNLRITAVSR